MSTVLNLGPSLDIRGVRLLLEHARKACASGEPLVVDGSEVTACDTAGAQLLISLSLMRTHLSWRLSAALEHELTQLGIPLSRFSPRVS